MILVILFSFVQGQFDSSVSHDAQIICFPDSIFWFCPNVGKEIPEENVRAVVRAIVDFGSSNGVALSSAGACDLRAAERRLQSPA